MTSNDAANVLAEVQNLYAAYVDLRAKLIRWRDGCGFGRNPGAPPCGQRDVDQALARYELGLGVYLAAWESGLPIPHGWMECDGPFCWDGEEPQNGRHLRKIEQVECEEVSAHKLSFLPRLLTPVTAPGEEVVWSLGSSVPVILAGRMAAI